MMSGIAVLAGGATGDSSTRVAGFSKRKAMVSPVSAAVVSATPGSCDAGWFCDAVSSADMQIPSFLENITYRCAFVQYPNGVIVDMRIISYVGCFDIFSPIITPLHI